MILTLDVGGTKTIFALWQSSCYELSLLEKFEVPTFEIDNLGDFILGNLGDKISQVETAVIALAGPICGDEFFMTNTSQTFHLGEIRKQLFAIGKVYFINDLEALGWEVATINKSNLEQLKIGVDSQENRLVIGIGTGCGVAATLSSGQVLPSEAGHVDFAPKGEIQRSLQDFLLKKYDYVSVENLVSGMGIANIFDFFASREIDGYSELKNVNSDDFAPELITQYASDKTCQYHKIACDTFELFTEILAQTAANFAMNYLPYGGIYIGGGIPAKILHLLDYELFTKDFLCKGKMNQVLFPIPVYIIIEETAVSQGAAKYARKA